MAEEQNRTLQDKFMLRLPDGMRDRIAEEARKSGRSMNAEIVHRLANSLGSPSFSDMTLGLGEELDFDLMVQASYNNRSLKEEMIYRLKQSLGPEQTLVKELENRAWEARKKYDDILKLFIQLTPEERRILEERLEVIEHSPSISKFSSKQIGEFIQLNPIGKKGRMIFTKPASDYAPLFPPEQDEE